MATQAAGADVLQGGSSRQRLAPLPAESQRPKQLLPHWTQWSVTSGSLGGLNMGETEPTRIGEGENTFTHASSLLAVHHQAACSIQAHL